MRRALTATVLLTAALLFGCSRDAGPEGRQAVMTYTRALIQAYRTSDETVLDPLVTEQQGRKVLGLIGVKRDAGLLLDSRLDDIQFESARIEDGRLVVETRERWSYADVSLQTRKVVGEPSTDHYAMRYTFVRDGERWKLAELEFRTEPKVGRKQEPLKIDARAAHGLGPADDPPAGGGGTPPAADPPPAPKRP